MMTHEEAQKLADGLLSKLQGKERDDTFKVWMEDPRTRVLIDMLKNDAGDQDACVEFVKILMKSAFDAGSAYGTSTIALSMIARLDKAAARQQASPSKEETH